MKKKWPRVRERVRVIDGAVKRDWCVDCGVMEGKRKQEFFLSVNEANRRAEEIKAEVKRVGAHAFALTADQRTDAARAFERLPAGIQMVDVVAFWLRHHTDSMNITLAEIHAKQMEAAVAAKLRPRSIATLRCAVAGFVREYGAIPVCEITHEHCETWLRSCRGVSDTTYSNSVRYLRMLFQFAIRRRFLAASPMTGIEKPKVVREDIQFMAVDDVQRILAEAEESDPEIVPLMAVGFFAGIRSAELHRLTWADIQFDNRLIVVGARAAKCNQKRFVHMEDNLVEWLVKYRKPAGVLGLGHKRFGIHRAEICKKLKIDWPVNAMRHSFATYHLARGEDAAKTAFELGHTQGVQLLYKHYRGLTTKSEAERFWSIQPAQAMVNQAVG